MSSESDPVEEDVLEVPAPAPAAPTVSVRPDSEEEITCGCYFQDPSPRAPYCSL